MNIKGAYKEIELNKCDSNYKNPKIISSKEINLAPIRPPIVRISPSFGSLKGLEKYLSLQKTEINIDNNNIKNKSKQKEKDIETKSNKSLNKYRYSLKSDKYKEMLKEQENLKKLDKIKKNIHTNTKITKKRQFGNEILALFKYNWKLMYNLNNKNFDQNLFERKKYNSPNNIFSQSSTLINAWVKLVTQNKINNYLNLDNKKNYNFRYDVKGNLLRNKNKRNYNYGNYSFTRDDRMNKSMNKSTSRIEITNISSLEN